MNDLFISPTKENIEAYTKEWKEIRIRQMAEERLQYFPKEFQTDEYRATIEEEIRVGTEKCGAYAATKMKNNSPVLILEDVTINVSDILKPLIGLEKEILTCAFFDDEGKNIFTYHHHGTVSSCGGEEQYGECLRLLAKDKAFDKATKIVMYHNHPRHVAAIPSAMDIVQTARARTFFDICGIKMIDAGVVTDFDFCSALQGGDEKWHDVLQGRYPVHGMMGELLDKKDELLHYMRIVFPRGW